MSLISEERVALAQTVLRPMPSFRTHNPHQKPEERLEKAIQHLENHNNEVRAHILSQSHALHQNLISDSSLPAPCPPQQSQAIAAALKVPHKTGAPTPIYTPLSSRPLRTGSPPTIASNITDTVEKLEIFNEQAKLTLAPYLAEKERLKPRGLEVPEGFGQAGATNYDASRDPRVRR